MAHRGKYFVNNDEWYQTFKRNKEALYPFDPLQADQ